MASRLVSLPLTFQLPKMDRSLDAIIAERPVSQHFQLQNSIIRKIEITIGLRNGLLTRIYNRSRTVVVALKVKPAAEMA